MTMCTGFDSNKRRESPAGKSQLTISWDFERKEKKKKKEKEKKEKKKWGELFVVIVCCCCLDKADIPV